MLKNKFLKIAALGTGLLILTACSTTHKAGGAGMGGAGIGTAGGADSSGAGQMTSFGEQGNAQALRVGNQSYYFDFNRDRLINYLYTLENHV